MRREAVSDAPGAGDVVATRIDRTEAEARLARHFARWPRSGLRWSSSRGYAAEIHSDGFAVRSLPTLRGSPLFEAIGRWRDGGGASVEVVPMALAYMPLVLTNAVVLTVLLMAVLFFGARGNLEQTIEGTGFLGLMLFAFVLLAQLGLIALVELRTGDAERREVITQVRSILGD
ncbi:MAG: hypothetical protein AUH85_18425 [Chloroflexi bacterium 13_1_40CM_4_68_4]|nr:MAG: hypothetical protein AUH85_18425 [Chloroflexi bacterium 13_1_40CM_4_68_4]